MSQRPLPPAPVSLLRAVHPFPSFAVALLTVAILPLADPDAPASLYALLGISMLLFQFAIGLANDVVDAEADALAKPWKAIPRGLLTRQLAIALTAVCAGAGLLVSSVLDLTPWLIGLAGLACGLLYDMALKRTVLSWLPFAIALPLLPLWVFTAAGAWSPLLWWVLPLGAVLGFALHLANQSPDIPADSAAGIEGAAHRLGQDAAHRLALAAYGLAASGATLVLLFAEPGRAVVAALIAGVVLVLSPVAPRAFGSDGLFGLLLAGAAALALDFLSAA